MLTVDYFAANQVYKAPQQKDFNSQQKGFDTRQNPAESDKSSESKRRQKELRRLNELEKLNPEQPTPARK